MFEQSEPGELPTVHGWKALAVPLPWLQCSEISKLVGALSPSNHKGLYQG